VKEETEAKEQGGRERRKEVWRSKERRKKRSEGGRKWDSKERKKRQWKNEKRKGV